MLLGSSRLKGSDRLRLFSTILLLALGVNLAPGQTPAPRSTSALNPQLNPASQVATSPLRLEDLEQMALKANPTLAQAEATIRVAEGNRVQAGLLPNPIVGYEGAELAFRAIGEKSEHLAFIEQTIPLGGKLKKSRAIFTQEKLQSELGAAAQRQRILNGVRMLFYRALGAQQLVEVRTALAKLARDAVKVTGELFNVGQADRPDVAQQTLMPAEIYACPMHPEVRSNKEGTCPKCNMKLVKKQKAAALTEEEKKKVPGYPQDMMMIMDDEVAKPETFGLAPGWTASMMGMMTLVRVLPEDKYNQIMEMVKKGQTEKPKGSHEHKHEG